MVAVTLVTAWAMVGNLFAYYANFEELWLLSLSGTLILALDIWIMLEGFRVFREIDASGGSGTSEVSGASGVSGV